MTVTKHNAAVSQLVKEAMADADMKSVDVARVTGLTRGPVEAVIRGEVQRVHPEVANVVCKRLGIRMERFLRACGYDLPATPQADLPDRLAVAWAKLPKKTQTGMLELIEKAASQIDPAPAPDPK